MTREEKKALILKVLSQKWWTEEYSGYFTEDFGMELPFAPPGMTQVLSAGQSIVHREWLSQTVKSWETDIYRVYGPREEDGRYYFLIWNGRGEVEWGGTEGLFENLFVTRVCFRDDKICQIREWSNPFKWLTAAGREVPLFAMRIPMCNELSRAIHAPKPPVPEYDMSPEACEARRLNNALCFLSTGAGACAPQKSADHKRYVRFVPHEMKEDVTPEEREYFDLWLACSERSPWKWEKGAIMYETDDPRYYFFEPCGHGQYHWQGNEQFGRHYMNSYLCYIELNDEGLCSRYDEFLNPINKMNSINVSVPSFPWLF